MYKAAASVKQLCRAGALFDATPHRARRGRDGGSAFSNISIRDLLSKVSDVSSHLADALADELLQGRMPIAIRREGENDIHLDAIHSTMGNVMITAQDDALIVSIGGHTTCRFALGDYGHLRSAIRPWSAVIDVAEFLRELVRRGE